MSHLWPSQMLTPWTLHARSVISLWMAGSQCQIGGHTFVPCLALARALSRRSCFARALGRYRHRRSMHAVERRWARLMTRHLDIQLDISGLDHIVPGTPYIVTPLHEGLADVLAVLHLPLDLRFVARDELFEWPFFGGLLRDTDK